MIPASVRGLRGPSCPRGLTKRVHKPGPASVANVRKLLPLSRADTGSARPAAARSPHPGAPRGEGAAGARRTGSARRKAHLDAPGRASSGPGSRTAVSGSARGAPAPQIPSWHAAPQPGCALLPARPDRSYPGNGQGLLEVLAPHEAEAPWSRALEDYLLGGHGETTRGDRRGRTRCAGLPGSCRRKSARREHGEPGAGGRRERAGAGAAPPRPRRPARPPACPRPLLARRARTGGGFSAARPLRRTRPQHRLPAPPSPRGPPLPAPPWVLGERQAGSRTPRGRQSPAQRLRKLSLEVPC